VGTYHSSKIWSFHMLTGCCANALEIHTDPKACEYIVVKGGRRKVEEYTAEDAETQELRSRQGTCDVCVCVCGSLTAPEPESSLRFLLVLDGLPFARGEWLALVYERRQRSAHRRV